MLRTRFIISFIGLLTLAPSASAVDGSKPRALPLCIQEVDNNKPEESAWRLFACLNKKVRHQVGGPIVFWETLPMPEDLYCKADKNTNCNPQTPPVLPRLSSSLRLESVKEQDTFRQEMGGALPPPHHPDDFDGGQEVHLNETIFNYVVLKKLWYLQGQQEAFLNMDHIDFPMGAIETKARWLLIDRIQRNRYLWRKDKRGNYFGLIALNITAKSQPQWFWTTFEHVDNPQRCLNIPCFNVDSEVEPPLRSDILRWLKSEGLHIEHQPWWLNYRLHGVQTQFVNDSGDPTLLGNSVLEAPFEGFSTCITCHSRAARSFDGTRLSLTESGSIPTGKPKRIWFCDTASDTRKVLTLDYVWSLADADLVNNLPSPMSKPAPPCGSFDWLPQ
jgi:hypothetical protein